MKTYKTLLTKQQKADWIKALASGKYSKGTNTLVQSKTSLTTSLKSHSSKCDLKFCCIGVLADIRDDIVISNSGDNIETLDGNRLSYYGGDIGIPRKVIKKLVEVNDSTYGNDTDFKRVIPIIEQIVPTFSFGRLIKNSYLYKVIKSKLNKI